MKWYSVKTHIPPHNGGECLVATDDRDLFLATYKYYDESDDYLWIADIDGEPLNSVTHFAIINPIPLDE